MRKEVVSAPPFLAENIDANIFWITFNVFNRGDFNDFLRVNVSYAHSGRNIFFGSIDLCWHDFSLSYFSL